MGIYLLCCGAAPRPFPRTFALYGETLQSSRLFPRAGIRPHYPSTGPAASTHKEANRPETTQVLLLQHSNKQERERWRKRRTMEERETLGETVHYGFKWAREEAKLNFVYAIAINPRKTSVRCVGTAMAWRSTKEALAWMVGDIHFVYCFGGMPILSILTQGKLRMVGEHLPKWLQYCPVYRTTKALFSFYGKMKLTLSC